MYEIVLSVFIYMPNKLYKTKSLDMLNSLTSLEGRVFSLWPRRPSDGSQTGNPVNPSHTIWFQCSIEETLKSVIWPLTPQAFRLQEEEYSEVWRKRSVVSRQWSWNKLQKHSTSQILCESSVNGYNFRVSL